MKKVLFVFAIAMLSFGAVNAQESSAGGLHFGGGLRVALPIGDFSNGTSFGLGLELQGEYLFSDKFSGTFTTGYTSFFAKEIDGEKGDNTGYIPVLAGVRVYPSPQFFIGAKAGLGIITGGGESTSGFNYEPQIGYNGEKFQLALGYNAMTQKVMGISYTTGAIALTGIYKFN